MPTWSWFAAVHQFPNHSFPFQIVMHSISVQSHHNGGKSCRNMWWAPWTRVNCLSRMNVPRRGCCAMEWSTFWRAMPLGQSTAITQQVVIHLGVTSIEVHSAPKIGHPCRMVLLTSHGLTTLPRFFLPHTFRHSWNFFVEMSLGCNTFVHDWNFNIPEVCIIGHIVWTEYVFNSGGWSTALITHPCSVEQQSLPVFAPL